MPSESNILAALYRRERDLRRRERYHALYLLSLGYKQCEIACILCKDEDTVSRWKQQWESKQKIDDESRSGRPPEVDEKLKKKIVKMVDENNPKKHGFNVAHWDCRELQSWLALKGTLVSQETIRQVLLKNGFRYVKTGYELAKADKKEQQSFVKRFKSLIRSKTPASVIMFADAMNNKLHPKQGYIWTREKKPVVATHDSHKRIHTTGAVNPVTGELVTRTSKKFNQSEFIAFLKKLLAKVKKPITLFLDGHKSHKTPAVKNFLSEYERLKLEFLPKYSPKLNPIEHLWGYVRKKRTNNIEFKNQRSLMKTLQNYFSNLPSETIQKVCSLNCILNPG